MTKNTLKTRIEGVRKHISELQKKEKRYVQELQDMEDAENLKIIKKHNISPEQLNFFRGLSVDEIELGKKKREEAKVESKQEKEKAL